MFHHLKHLWQRGRKDPQSPLNARAQLLVKYPTHLALIDSCEIPHTYETGPDLSYYTESAEYYYSLICSEACHLKDKPRASTSAERERSGLASRRMASAEWGLIAHASDAIPFALKLLASSDPDIRGHGAGVFCGLRNPEHLPKILPAITRVLETEQDRETIDSLLVALGEFRSRDAIPCLARFILDQGEDLDTRWTAAQALGKVIRKRFDKKNSDAVALAVEWLEKNS